MLQIKKPLIFKGFSGDGGFEPTCRVLAGKRISSAPRYDRFATSPYTYGTDGPESPDRCSLLYTIFLLLCSGKSNFFLFLIPSSAEIRIHSRCDPSHQLILVAFVLKPPVLVGIA